MTLYVGETVRVRAVVTDPDTGDALSPRGVEVDFWEPGKKPATDPTVRNTPDRGPFPLAYRAAEQDWVAYIDTSGWTPGKSPYRITVTGSSYENWEYASLSLKA